MTQDPDIDRIAGAQSMGATLGALEARGLVERRPDPEDGRRAVMSLTEAGLRTLRNRRNAGTQQLAKPSRPGSRPRNSAN